jgi:hypothetical protein
LRENGSANGKVLSVGEKDTKGADRRTDVRVAQRKRVAKKTERILAIVAKIVHGFNCPEK